MLWLIAGWSFFRFVAKAKELAQKRKVGNPTEGGVDQGPQVDKESFDKVRTV